MKQDKNLLCTTPQSALQEEILIENTHTKKEKSLVHTTDKTKEKGGKKVNTVITIEMSQSQLNPCVLQEPVECPCPSLSPPAPVPVCHHLPLSQSVTTCPCPSLSPPAPVPVFHHLPLGFTLRTHLSTQWRERTHPDWVHTACGLLTASHTHELAPGLQCPHLHHHYCHTIQSVKAMTGKKFIPRYCSLSYDILNWQTEDRFPVTCFGLSRLFWSIESSRISASLTARMSGTLQSVVRKKMRPKVMPYVVPGMISFFSLKTDYEAHPLGATDTSYQR